MVNRLPLHDILEIISYSGLLTAIGFGIMGVYVFDLQTPLAQGFTLTATLLSLISAGLHRLGTRPITD